MIASPLFPGQKPDEQVKLLVRPHWLVMLRPIAAILFLAIIPIVALVVLSAGAVELFSGVGLAVTAVTVPAYYLSLITWLFIAWVDYYLDVGIVTDHRIIDIDQRGLFRRNVAELDCRMVQDINADKTGILQTLFNFGDVIVQTAGETPNFSFHAIPRPEQMVDRIQEVVQAGLEEKTGAAEKINEAASKVEKATGKISDEQRGEDAATEKSEQPAPPADRVDVAASAGQAGGRASHNSGTPAPPASEESPQDLPRQYER